MKKFRMLRTLIYTLKGIGWLAFIVAIALSLVIMISPDVLLNYGIDLVYGSIWITALSIALVGILYAILFLGVAEHLAVLLSIQDNLKDLRKFFIDNK